MTVLCPQYEDNPQFAAMTNYDRFDIFAGGCAALMTGITSVMPAAPLAVVQQDTGADMKIGIVPFDCTILGTAYSYGGSGASPITIAAVSLGARRDAVVYRAITYTAAGASTNTFTLPTAQANTLCVGMGVSGGTLPAGTTISSLSAPSGGNVTVTLSGGTATNVAYTFTGIAILMGSVPTQLAAGGTGTGLVGPWTVGSQYVPPAKASQTSNATNSAGGAYPVVNTLLELNDCPLAEIYVDTTTTAIVNGFTGSGNIVDKTKALVTPGVVNISALNGTTTAYANNGAVPGGTSITLTSTFAAVVGQYVTVGAITLSSGSLAAGTYLITAVGAGTFTILVPTGTPGTGTYTSGGALNPAFIPATSGWYRVNVLGSGGGGASGNTGSSTGLYNGGGGGGQGESKTAWLFLTAGTVYNCTIGAGGQGASHGVAIPANHAGVNGNGGNSSSFGSLVASQGGGAGTNTNAASGTSATFGGPYGGTGQQNSTGAPLAGMGGGTTSGFAAFSGGPAVGEGPGGGQGGTWATAAAGGIGGLAGAFATAQTSNTVGGGSGSINGANGHDATDPGAGGGGGGGGATASGTGGWGGNGANGQVSVSGPFAAPLG